MRLRAKTLMLKRDYFHENKKMIFISVALHLGSLEQRLEVTRKRPIMTSYSAYLPTTCGWVTSYGSCFMCSIRCALRWLCRSIHHSTWCAINSHTSSWWRGCCTACTTSCSDRAFGFLEFVCELNTGHMWNRSYTIEITLGFTTLNEVKSMNQSIA